MNSWKKHKFIDVINLIGGGTPKTTVKEYWDGNIPWLSVVDFNNGQKRVYDTEKKITELGLKNSSTKILKKGQLILSARGTVGILSELGRDMAFNQSCYGLDAKKEFTTNNFLYYLMEYNIKHFKSNAYGSVFDTITTSTFENIEIVLPTLSEQQAIAEILSSLDDKIELNLQTNKTLEEMANALYKHWFVDFGPFKDGKFINSELGLIPEGWEVRCLKDIVDVRDGTHDSPKRVDSGKYLITSKHIKENEIDYTNAYFISELDFEQINKRSKVNTGDILLTMIGTVGTIYLIKENPINFAIKNIGLIRTSETPEIQEFLFLFFKSPIGTEFIETRKTGSTQQYISLSELRNFPVIKPDKKTIIDFSILVKDYFNQIQNNIKENILLKQTRDYLLPKLISGEIRVKETLKKVKEVV